MLRLTPIFGGLEFFASLLRREKVYYELILNSVHIIELLWALINSSSELEFEINVLEYDVDAYLLIVEYNKENVSIDIKVRYLHRNDIKDKVCEIKFNGKKNLEEFIMANY